MSELDEIRAAIRKFRDERDWIQFHSPKNLACSIAIEAAELLEQFQWDSPEGSETNHVESIFVSIISPAWLQYVFDVDRFNRSRC